MASVSKLAWGLLALAQPGAAASLFGPGERQWGGDIGSNGTALFGFTLWAGAWLLVDSKTIGTASDGAEEFDERDQRIQRALAWERR